MKSLQSVLVLLFALVAASAIFAQGPLAPPSAPAPMMKSLAQIEPRTPITNLPATIFAPGSYYLVTNLAGSVGITLATNNVTLDLCGFTLTGPGKFAGGAACGVTGAYANIVVRNGRIREWPGNGVIVGAVGVLEDLNVENCGASGLTADQQSRVARCRVGNCGGNGVWVSHSSRLESCRLIANASNGVYAGNNSAVQDTEATYNTRDGIAAGNANAVHNCVAGNNARNGIWLGLGSSAIGCVAYYNSSDGISASSGCTIQDCTTRDNTGSGITTASRCTIVNCTAYENNQWGIGVNSGCTISGCTASENGTNILAGAGCYILNNTCIGSGYGAGVGIRIAPRTSDSHSGNRLEGNTVSSLAIGIDVRDGGNLIVRNSAWNNAVGYSITNNNSVGGITNVMGATFTCLNPWVNFEF